MKKQSTEFVRDVQNEDVDDSRARRMKFVVTHLFIFFACLAASVCIWLVVHYANADPSVSTDVALGGGVAFSDELLI